jgi:hypothetical protein
MGDRLGTLHVVGAVFAAQFLPKCVHIFLRTFGPNKRSLLCSILHHHQIFWDKKHPHAAEGEASNF